ncbi:DUF835 domain-containing protein [Thermococcus sp. JdF3]|uniref:DUF835 domain-containing protein n=1 Tax=Thermococcus sp. JdF3 TaxID=1638258 RepID=UPI00143C28C0|nr:DUF835 domain-containing protein [Thermococcus sp. JdF3]NJE00491.1 DUF835 domain-containing protein [Thermococcus sp. JdF3]
MGVWMNLLLTSQLLSFSLKVVAGLALFLNWRRYRRDSLLLWALFFLSSSLSTVSDFTGLEVGIPLFHAAGVSFLVGGVVSLLDEEAVGVSTRSLKLVALTLPLTVSSYIILYASYVTKPVPIYISFGISGIFYTFAGVILWSVRRFYPRSGTLLSAVIILHGVHKMDYPFLRPVEWFAPIGFTLGAFFNVLEVIAFLQVVLSERFRHVGKTIGPDVIKKGVFIVPPDRFASYIEALSEFPVLAFTRKRDLPDKWEVHSLTTIEEPGNIGPTQLHRIIERTRSYLAEAHREGVTGVVVIEGLEYLMMYDDFRSLMKFLATLSDYVTLYGGMLLLVLDERSPSEKQLKTLRQVLNVGD